MTDTLYNTDTGWPSAADANETKGGTQRSWLLQKILLNQEVPKTLWIPEKSRELDQASWSPVSAMVFQRKTHEIPNLGKHLIREDAAGENPLHWCAQWNYLQETIYFIKKGANPLAKNKDGMTPLDLSVNDLAVQKVLKEAITKRFMAPLVNSPTLSI